ncbi:hypothetical protein SynA18461_01981 [Synechococcus sp. A18-46.1]|nr:hypothetical protein SynA18461_01981 [Synechococcus sp. A18-46.1]
MESSSRQTKDDAIDLTRIVVAIGLGLACLLAVMAGGAFFGRSLSEIMETTELAPPEAINPLR